MPRTHWFTIPKILPVWMLFYSAICPLLLSFFLWHALDCTKTCFSCHFRFHFCAVGCSPLQYYTNFPLAVLMYTFFQCTMFNVHNFTAILLGVLIILKTTWARICSLLLLSQLFLKYKKGKSFKSSSPNFFARLVFEVLFCTPISYILYHVWKMCTAIIIL